MATTIADSELCSLKMRQAIQTYSGYTRSLSLVVGCVVPMFRKFVQDFVPNTSATASMLALLVVVDMLLLVQFGGIDGSTLEASILKHWPTIGQPLDNHWPTIGQPLLDH